jgi:hypothetical protein
LREGDHAPVGVRVHRQACVDARVERVIGAQALGVKLEVDRVIAEEEEAVAAPKERRAAQLAGEEVEVAVEGREGVL